MWWHWKNGIDGQRLSEKQALDDCRKGSMDGWVHAVWDGGVETR